MTLESTVILLDTVFLQEVDDEIILLETNSEEYFSLNQVGGIFYQVLQEESNLLKALKMLEEHFEVPQAEIEKDFLTFLEDLEKKGLIAVA